MTRLVRFLADRAIAVSEIATVFLVVAMVSGGLLVRFMAGLVLLGVVFGGIRLDRLSRKLSGEKQKKDDEKDV